MVIITTSKSLILLYHKCGKSIKIHSTGAHYYGITRYAEGWIVGHRNRSNTSLIPKNQEQGEILLFDHDLFLRFILKADFPLIDIHQIMLDNGTLYVTCPFENMVAIFDGTWRKWFPAGEIDDGDKDIHHFNSITAHED